MNDSPIKFFILFSVLFFSLTSCANQKDVIYLNKRLNSLNRKSEKNEKDFKDSFVKLEKQIRANESRQNEINKRVDEDQKSMRFHLAKIEADLLKIQDGIQGLTGKIEENRYLLKGAIEVDTTTNDTMRSKVDELSSLVDDLKPRIERIESSLRFKPSTDKKMAGLEKAPPVQKTLQKDISSPLKKEETEVEHYNTALGYYRNEQYEEAMAGFKSFLNLHPKSKLADNAYFWIGESYRSLTKYEEAILAYQKVINHYPKGNKVPAAMLQQALTFERIKDKTTANLVFKELVKKFPKTKEAQIARKRLQKK